MYHVFLFTAAGRLMDQSDEDFNNVLLHLYEDNTNALQVKVSSDTLFPPHLLLSTDTFTDEGISVILKECLGVHGIRWKCLKELCRPICLI